MAFTRHGRIKEALAQPFPERWRDLLSVRMVHWQMLNSYERQHLEELIRIILVDKNWEATHGFALTEEIRVLIAAMACLLILGLDYDYYDGVDSIIVSPTTEVLTGGHPVGGGLWTDQPDRVIGLAEDHGPVLIAWDAAKHQARDPERGHNVVYHEFAHKLDMLEGGVDGAPPLDSNVLGKRWQEVCNREFDLLREGKGGDLLDRYGSTNVGEFFAVITEVFFDKPLAMQEEKPELYEVLRDFYKQDPAVREALTGRRP